MIEFGWAMGTCVAKEMNKEFQKQLLVQVMRAQLDLAQVSRPVHHHRFGILQFCTIGIFDSCVLITHDASLPTAFLLSSPESYGMSTGEAGDR